MLPPTQPQAFLGSILKYFQQKSIFSYHIIDHWIVFGKTRHLLTNGYKSNHYPFHGSRPTKHFAGTKFGSHVFASATLVLRSSISSPNYFSSRANIAILTEAHGHGHIFECCSLASLRLTHQVLSSITIALSNDLPSIHNTLSYLQAANFLSRL